MEGEDSGGVPPPPPDMKPSSLSLLLEFVFLTS